MRTALLLALLVAPSVARAQDDPADLKARFLRKERAVLVEAGNRHLDLVWWCRNRGLTAQATMEIAKAVEVSRDENAGAHSVLQLMREQDEQFWKKRRPGSESSRKSYEKKATKARRDDQEDFFELAEWAWKKEIEDDALSIYRHVLQVADAGLEFDEEGRIVLEFGLIPAAASAELKEGAVTIDGRLYLRNEFLTSLPDLDDIHEVDSPTLRVRGTVPKEEVEALHAMGLALMPHLEADLHAKPTRKFDLFVFATRSDYHGWLDSADLAYRRNGAGLADPQTFTAMVCAEEIEDPMLVAGMALHELTHLFWYGISPSVLPDWFEEGYAETFGGQGTFTWDGKKLTVGGKMDEFRLATLRDREELLPLSELLAADNVSYINEGVERGQLYYAQSWAFVRYLREVASADVQGRFDTWVNRCVGNALGVDFKNARGRDTYPATDLFRKTFGKELRTIEQDFLEWVETL